MANDYRLRSNFQSGTLTAGIDNVATTLSSAEFATLPVVDSYSHLPIVLDPRGLAGDPEIVYVTSHTASATTATVVRAQEGTSARSHATDVRWVHTSLTSDVVGWVLLERIELSAVASNTYGNCRFSNIPSGFKRLRVKSDWFSHSSTSNGHLYMRFNNVSTNNYHNWMSYHTSGSWTGTQADNQTQGYAIYNYLYGGSGRYSTVQIDINDPAGLKKTWTALGHTVMGTTQYPYGSEIQASWEGTADITQIDLWTSTAANWDASSSFDLYGWKE